MLEMQRLYYAVEVERTGSISRAAEKLYVSQPFLSREIKALESSIGIELFNRTSRGVIPTVKGKEFLAHARELLDSAEDLENRFLPQRTAAYRLEFAVPIACYISHSFVRFVQSLDSSGGLHIDYREVNTMNAVQRVVDHDCNLGIIRYPLRYEDYFLRYVESKDLKAEPLWTFNYRLVLRKSDPLCRKPVLETTDLKDRIEISHGDPMVPSMSVSAALELRRTETEGKEILVYERQSQFELLSELPDAYMWASPTPHRILDAYPIVERACVGASRCRDVLIWRRGYRFTDGERRFVDTVRDTIRELESEDTAV